MNTLSKKHYIIYALLGGALILSLAFGIYKDVKSEEYAYKLSMDYQRCFTEMVQYVDDLNLSLEKSRFVNDPMQMAQLSGEIYRQAADAGANLALLPLSGAPLENVNRFLVQAGNFAHTLSMKMLNGEAITNEEYDTLAKLSDYAKNLSASLDKDLEDVYNGRLALTGIGKEPSGLDAAMGEVDDQLHEYPALIYDGPFSSHLNDRTPLFIENMPEVSMEEARARASHILKDEIELEIVEEQNTVPAYYFYGGEVSLAITKKGGYLLYYLNNREIGDEKIDMADARIAAVTFLEENGFGDMYENYYEKMGNIAVINFAPKQEGYTLYPDLVKVKVALDNGEVIGCEARRYIMYHTERSVPEIKVSIEAALEKINPNVTIAGESLALIPREDGTEAFCWQIEGRIDERRCLIYVNTVTGAEEQILLLIESENGILTA